MLRSKKQSKPVVMPPPSPFDDPASIGNILLTLGKITKEQLFAAVGRQAQFNEALLGALLREMGVINADDIAQAMKIQEKMRKGDELAAALDVLDAKTADFKKCQDELRGAIDKSKQRRRDKGEESGLFLLPPHLQKA